MRVVIIISVLLLCVPNGWAEYSLPVDRNALWSLDNAGIPGGIPVRGVCVDVANPPPGCNDCTPDNSGNNNAATQIQNAINYAYSNCATDERVVLLENGTYRLTSSISFKDYVVLRGRGPGNTTLKINASSSDSKLINLGSAGYSNSTYVDVIGGHTKGSSQLILEPGNSNIQPGDFVSITQDNNNTITTVSSVGVGSCNWCGYGRSGDNISWSGGKRTVGQLLKILGRKGDTVTVNPPLYWNYQSNARVGLLEYNNMPVYRGIEDLKITSTNDINYYGITAQGAAYCWLKNIEMHRAAKQKHVETYGAYRWEIRDSYFHEAGCYAGDHGYGLHFQAYGTGILIENNIFDNLHLGVAIANGGGSGNIIAYNYFDHPRYEQSCGAGEYAMLHSMILFHGAHPHYNLVEGNHAITAMADGYWGSSSHNVAFRNRFKGYDGEHNQFQFAVQLDAKETYFSIIGNVLGTKGQSSIYERYGKSYKCQREKLIYLLGYQNPGDVDQCSSSEYDSSVRDTLLRHANYDYVTKSVQQNGSDDLTLPASLYLTSKPSFFGSIPWPAIGPDLTPMVGSLPAQVRYEQR